MALSVVQEMLTDSLKHRGADDSMIITIGLMFQKSEDAMIDLGAWIADMKNPSQTAILEKALEIEENLPPSLRTSNLAE